MSDLNITQQPLPDPNQLYNQGKQSLGDLRELKVGAGSSIFFTDKEGSRWGHPTFEGAQAFIKIDGSYKFKLSDGTVILDSLGTGGNFVNVLNSALNTASKTILSDFTFQSTDYAGAFKAGNPTWDSITGLITGGSGVLINARGILGANAGVPTFTLDATTGNASFAGDLVAATGTLGALTIASGGNIKFGKTAYTDDTNAGLWLGDVSGVAKLNIGSSDTKYLHYDGTNLSMLGGTITGGIIQTATTGHRMRLTGSTNSLDFLDGSSNIGHLSFDGSYVMELQCDNGISIHSSSSNPFQLIGNEHVQLTYNNGGGSGIFGVYNDTTIVASFDDSNDFTINGGVYSTYIQSTGDIKCGGTFKSSDNSSGLTSGFSIVTNPYGTAKGRDITVKDGLITHISSEYNL